MPTISTSTTITLPAGQKLVISGAGATATATVNPGSLAQIYDVGVGQDILGPFDRATPVRVDIRSGSVTYNVIPNERGANATYYVPADATFADIVALAESAEVTGGGHIIFMPTTYNIGDNTLPVLQGVYYEGVGMASTMEDRALRFGTLIKSTSTTKPVFGYNFVDRGARYATSDEFFAKNALGAGIRHLNIEGGAFGVKVGALYESGVENFVLRDVCSFAAQNSGFHLENCHIVSVKNVISYEHRRAGFVYYTSGAGYWNHGQNDIQHVVCQTGIRNAHGAIIASRGLNSSLNDTHVRGICAIGGGSEFTETVTLTAGSPNIPVSDLSKYAIGCGVQFTGTLGTVTGFQASTATFLSNYFVVAVSGTTGAGTIQVSEYYGFTPITPGGTGTASVTLGGRGGTAILWGSDDTYGVTAFNTSCTLNGVDTESSGTVELLIQRMSYSVANTGITAGGGAGQPARLNSATLVVRDCGTDIQVNAPKRADGVDWDGRSFFTYNAPEPIRTRSSMPGFGYNPTRFANRIKLGTEGENLYANRSTGASGLRPLTGIGTCLQLAEGDTAETTQVGNHTSCVTYRGGGTTYTLKGTSNANDESKGFILHWFNYNSTTVTLDGGGLNIEGLGTSTATISVPGKTGVMLQLRKANGTYFWARFV